MSEKPQAGTWTLTAPDGRQWQAESPLRCVRIEQLERIPATEQLRNIVDALQENAAQDASAYASGVKAGREEAAKVCEERAAHYRKMIASERLHPTTRDEYLALAQECEDRAAAIRALPSPADSGMVMVERQLVESALRHADFKRNPECEQDAGIYGGIIESMRDDLEAMLSAHEGGAK